MSALPFLNFFLQFSSVQFSRSVMSDSLQPHGLQPGRPVHHQLPEFAHTHVHRAGDAIQPSHPLLSLLLPPQSFPASGAFPISHIFIPGGHSIGVSASVCRDPDIQRLWRSQ